MDEENHTLTIVPPNVDQSIREAFAAKRQDLDKWAEQHKKSIDRVRDEQARRLDEAVKALATSQRDFAVKSRRSGKRKSGVAQKGKRAEVEARPKAVFKHLLEKGEPVPSSEIAHALNLTKHKTLRALNALIEDRMVRRVGENSSIKYEVKPGATREHVGVRTSSDRVEPIHDRLRRSIEKRGMATPDELARECRLPFDQVQRGCSELIRESTIELTFHEGRRVYSPIGAAA
jgi:hypothetical protein